MIPVNELLVKVRVRNIKTILSNVFVGSGSGGATTFLQLTDVPSSYSGQAAKVVRVNAGETALEFATVAGTGDVVGPVSAVADRIATFNGVTGKIIKDGGSKISDLQPINTILSALAALANAAGSLQNNGSGTLSWASSSGGFYTLHCIWNQYSPVDGTTYYSGANPIAPSTTESDMQIVITKAGTIVAASIWTWANTVAGSGEAWSLSVRKNSTTDALIATVSVAGQGRIFTNTAMSMAVAVGDVITIKHVGPTWATNPTNVTGGGHIDISF